MTTSQRKGSPIAKTRKHDLTSIRARPSPQQPQRTTLRLGDCNWIRPILHPRHRGLATLASGDDGHLKGLSARSRRPASICYGSALMAVHKDCYAPIGLIQQGGPRRRETFGSSDVKQLKACWPRSQIEVRESRHALG